MSDLDQLGDMAPKNDRPITDEQLQKQTGMRTIAVGETVHLNQLDYSLKRLMIGVGWDIPGAELSGMDVDCSLFLLDKNDMTREDSDFIFYNNLKGANDAVQHLGDNRTGAGDGDDEQMVISLNDLTFDVIKIVIAISIYDADMRDQSLMMLSNAYLRLVNDETGEELIRYKVVSEFTNPRASGLVAAELIREGPMWLLRALDEQVEGGLAPIATRYGMMVTG